MSNVSKAGSNQVITFGCRLNSYESESIKAVLNKTDQENLIVLNSCAVTSQAERELRQVIRRTRKTNPQAKIIVTGCAAQVNPEKYAKMPEVDLVLGNVEKLQEDSYSAAHIAPSNPENVTHSNHQDQIFFATRKSENNFLTVDETAKIAVNDIMSVKDTAPQLVEYFENKTRAFLEIQNGCNHRCTFCIIPFGRGNSRSVAFGDIVNQTRKMVASGHKEVVLTGVDITDYGKDFPVEMSLSNMIKRLLKLVPELPRLRLSSIDVAEIDEGIFELLANEPRFMPYLHLSLQSGDDLILKRMKRRHDRGQILDFCSKARKLRPEITFGADIIAGFPTETEEMFLNSARIIEEADIIFTHIFPYSKREGTPAAKMPQVDSKTIKERAKNLREIGERNRQNFLKKQIGKSFEIVMESDAMGKTNNFLDVKVMRRDLKSGEVMEVVIRDLSDGMLVA